MSRTHLTPGTSTVESDWVRSSLVGFADVNPVVGVIEYADIGQPDPTQLQALVTEAVNKVTGKATVTPTTF
jgi:hypothetical protein